MTEKELPFKLPLRFLPYSPGTVGPVTFGSLDDAAGNTIANAQTKEQADFICLACNSYFEQKKALKLIQAERNRIREGGKLTKADELKSDETLDAVLAKGVENESD